jgi:hypothetical protein
MSQSSRGHFRLAAQIVAGLILWQAPAAAQSACLAPNDTSVAIANWMSGLLTDSRAEAVAERDSVGLTGVQPSQVVPVSDSRTCSKIVTTLDHYEGVTRANRTVYAYSVGSSRFIVQDPNLRSGQWTPIFLLNSTYKIVRPYMVF